MKQNQNKPPRLHRHLVYAVIECLYQAFGEEYYIDKVIEREFKKNKKWGARDRKFVAESAYEITRWWRRLWDALEKEEVSVEEDALLEIFALYWLASGNELPPWDEFSSFNLGAAVNRYLAPEEAASKASLPDWVYDLIKAELSEDVDEAFEGLNRKANVILRVNTLKTDIQRLKSELEKENISTEIVDNYPYALALSQRANVFRTNAFKMGYFEVQDGASQTVSPLLDVQPGMRVIDACAGAGGKTLHLASMMNNKGTLIALDIHAHKLQELKKRARRAGVSIIETRPIETTKVIKRLKESADRILLDVPCSGLGVLRRNPDTKWKLTRERIDELLEIQKDILQRYATMLKPGGRMVYATCSVLTEENEAQVETFLANNSGWKLVHQERHWPHIEGFDGFFAAVLEKGE